VTALSLTTLLCGKQQRFLPPLFSLLLEGFGLSEIVPAVSAVSPSCTPAVLRGIGAGDAELLG
jgi:hypothetical protein